ncbi:putative membrane protein YphA (DoxX/SURF4 family) [Chryseobacterium defluvii]|uniref:Putative membrane protein YphA (DoxX/SURF4 family) n=1 Tax=Chryseobacterium defluvii TaxID=160396 RepID=A0A840KAH8_9FLAO|nr:hypothetical protein [Chryseobacterium defluvii]MBB4806389.1 putative membrane protein YphA (DoxX/SURF4 family) [Chryseobacterium defluvii]
MITKLRSVPKERYWEYFILVARFLLAFTFFSYGFGKLTVGQFGISPQEMATPIKDLSLFRVMWYLFGHEPFNTVVGILQLVTGVLLLFDRTAILGVVFFIPVAANILLMDISFMPESLAAGFTKRFMFYFFLCFLILWNDRDRIRIIWNTMIKKNPMKLRFPILLYLLVPVFALALEFLPAIPQIIYGFITEPVKTFELFQKIFHSLF